MKLCELIKDRWPEKRIKVKIGISPNDGGCSFCERSYEYCRCAELYNMAVTAIEPIKEMEVELNREVIGDLITDLQLGLSMEEKWKIANHLAANLGKFLVIRKPYEHQ